MTWREIDIIDGADDRRPCDLLDSPDAETLLSNTLRAKHKKMCSMYLIYASF